MPAQDRAADAVTLLAEALCTAAEPGKNPHEITALSFCPPDQYRLDRYRPQAEALWSRLAALAPPAVVPESVRRLSEAATPGTLYTVDPPWGDGTWIVAGSPDPHASFGVADCAGAFDRENERMDAPEAIRDASAAGDAAFLASAANFVRDLLTTPPSDRASVSAPPVSGGACSHPKTTAHYDHSTCDACGMIWAGVAGWRIARKKWFRSMEDARFYERHGRLPEPLATPELAAGGERETPSAGTVAHHAHSLEIAAKVLRGLAKPASAASCDKAATYLRSILSPSGAQPAGEGLAEIIAAKAAEIESVFGREMFQAARPIRGIYMASKTAHGPRWRQLRAEGVPIISTWIDEAGKGETADFTDLWQRCVNEAATATVVIVYRETGEVLKGAFVEVGAALSMGVPVYAVGCDEFSFVNHAGVTRADDLDAALALATASAAVADAPEKGE